MAPRASHTRLPAGMTGEVRAGGTVQQRRWWSGGVAARAVWREQVSNSDWRDGAGWSNTTQAS